MQNYVGKQIDRYRIIERLGMGGMAVVYKAYDTRLEREVALKLIRTESIPQDQHERLFKRFEREAKAHAKFDHKNIVHIYDYGEIDGSPYLVMSYLPGGTLKDRINGPTDWKQAVRWLTPIAEALAYAHKTGVVHRDVKPANILFDKNDQPILTDFGIAKILETNDFSLTGTGLGVGTPEYMSPEQWKGQPGQASDQYALGIVFYELITGHKPYSADTPAAIAIIQATEPLSLPSKYVKGIPESVEKALLKTLSQNPQDRYENIIMFTKALNESLLFTQSENGGDLRLLGEAETKETLDALGFSSKDRSSTETSSTRKKKRQKNISEQKEKEELYLGDNLEATSTQTIKGSTRNKKKRFAVIGILLVLILTICLITTPSLAILSNLFESSSQNTQNVIVEPSTTQPTVNEASEILFTETEIAFTTTLTPTIQLTNTPEPLNPVTEITGNSIYLRAGPDVNHPAISERMSKGEEVEILARNESGDWLLVLTTDGMEGWLYISWIDSNFQIESIGISSFIPTPLPTERPTDKPIRESYP